MTSLRPARALNKLLPTPYRKLLSTSHTHPTCSLLLSRHAGGKKRNSSRYLSNLSQRFSTSSSTAIQLDFTHAVIGGGVVGLSIASRLAARESDRSSRDSGLARNVDDVILLERRDAVGTETSSRGSEVIHAGIYYPKNSLKTALCIRGRQKLYDYCNEKGVNYRKTTKWVLAQDDEEGQNLEQLHKHSTDVGVPTRFLSRDEVASEEPDVRAEASALESLETGIVDSHGLMLSLLGDLEDAGGVLAANSDVKDIEILPEGAGFRITVAAEPGEEDTTITASTLTIAAGLSAVHLSNMLRFGHDNTHHAESAQPDHPTAENEQIADQPKKPYYAKGNYFAYNGPLRPKRLLYPAPTSNPGFAGLGTHLTLDLGGKIRFGPDVEWLDVEDAHTQDIFHPRSQIYKVDSSSEQMSKAVEAVQRYLPGISAADLSPDYVGIRPKLVGPGAGFEDFWIRRVESFPRYKNSLSKNASDNTETKTLPVAVELLGIESPGLTSSLAIGEYVEHLIYGGPAVKDQDSGDSSTAADLLTFPIAAALDL